MAIYLDYDQAALDDQYDVRRRLTDAAEHVGHREAASARVRGEVPCRLDIAYGAGPAERLDLFPPPVPSKAPPPALIYIHGGNWQLSDKSDTSFVAPAFAAAGVAFVSLNYALAPRIDVDGIVGQVRAAIAWVWRNAADLEIDRDRIVVAGHSAGGHLAAMAAATDWPVFASDLPADPIRAACGISGLYDLEPIRLCYLNRVLELDAGAAMRNSPIAVSPRLAGPILLAVGGDETDEFLRQQTTLTERWRETGAEIRAMLIPNVHHYSIIRALADADSTLFRAVCGLATAK
jgi:arylformamidase